MSHATALSSPVTILARQVSRAGPRLYNVRGRMLSSHTPAASAAPPLSGSADAAAPAAAEAPPPSNSRLRALRGRNFRLYLIGQSISNPGTWLQSTAQSWLVLDLTGSPAALAFVTALQFTPQL